MIPNYMNAPPTRIAVYYVYLLQICHSVPTSVPLLLVKESIFWMIFCCNRRMHFLHLWLHF